MVRAACEAEARLYFMAVAGFGRNAYEAAQDAVCIWNSCCFRPRPELGAL